MTSRVTVCGICDLRHITTPALVWCSECDEGLCVDCKEHHGLSKSSRNHNTVPISEYEKLPPSMLEITQFCKEHNEKYQIYCKKHGRPCCRRCVIEAHNDCKDITALDDVIRDVKTSNAFYEIEHMLAEVYENILRLREDRHGNLKRLEEERRNIEKEIQLTRLNVNAHLDKLQESIMKDLYEAESQESKIIRHLLQSLEEKANEISKYQENLSNIKQHASDLQIFLAMKEMERDVEEKDKFVSTLVNSDKLCQVSLSCKIKDVLQNALANIQKFGEIIIKTNASDCVLFRQKEKQAQIIVPHVPSKSIDNLSFRLQKTINTTLGNIRGCELLPDGRTVFSSYVQDCVKVFKSDGSQDFDISLSPAGAFDLTYIQDNNIIAVTSGGGDNRCISIIDVKGRKVKKTSPVSTFTDGVASRNKTLIFCARQDGLKTMNLNDESTSNIGANKMSCYAYVATFGDKLYYTNYDTHTVTCCDMHGSTQWRFKDENVLSFPTGISVDNDGNVYIVCCDSHVILVLSPDGQRHRQLLSKREGLFLPQALHYNRTSNQLLVANTDDVAFLFKID